MTQDLSRMLADAFDDLATQTESGASIWDAALNIATNFREAGRSAGGGAPGMDAVDRIGLSDKSPPHYECGCFVAGYGGWHATKCPAHGKPIASAAPAPAATTATCERCHATNTLEALGAFCSVGDCPYHEKNPETPGPALPGSEPDAVETQGVEVTRRTLRRIVDATWNKATESETVPATAWADRIINRVLTKPERAAEGEACRIIAPTACAPSATPAPLPDAAKVPPCVKCGVEIDTAKPWLKSSAGPIHLHCPAAPPAQVEGRLTSWKLEPTEEERNWLNAIIAASESEQEIGAGSESLPEALDRIVPTPAVPESGLRECQEVDAEYCRKVASSLLRRSPSLPFPTRGEKEALENIAAWNTRSPAPVVTTAGDAE